MQIYADAHGVQKLLETGVIAIDTDSGESVLPVLWDTEADGPIPNLAQVGGYSRDGNELVYSQATFDTNEALKATVATAQAAAQLAAIKSQAESALLSATGSPLTELQRWFAGAVLKRLNLIHAEVGFATLSKEAFLADILEQKDL